VALNRRAGRAGRGGLASKQRAGVGVLTAAGGMPAGSAGRSPACANSDAARGTGDFKAPRSTPGLGVRDLGKARGLGMRPSGPRRRGQAQRGRGACGRRRRRGARSRSDVFVSSWATLTMIYSQNLN
jgi:hypothetical protein